MKTLAGMSKPRRNVLSILPREAAFPVRQRRRVPHEFVLEAIAPLSPYTPMFGCHDLREGRNCLDPGR